jgi:polar amino acid transport system permease protein
VAAVILLADWAKVQRVFFDPEIAAKSFPEVLTVAAKNTIIFTIFGFTGGLLLGLGLALMRLSTITPYRWFAGAYIEIFRGIPAVVTLLLVGFVLPIALNVRIPGTYGPGSVGLAIVAAAYMGETIRGGIQAVPRGQVEASRSLGMSGTQTQFWIVIPQAFRIMLPPLTNELVLLLKDTALVALVLGSTAATVDIYKFARNEVAETFNGTPLVVAAFVYLLITLPLTYLARWLERRGGRGR